MGWFRHDLLKQKLDFRPAAFPNIPLPAQFIHDSES